MGNKEILISVIIPVYKAEKYLHRCVDSVLNQTYRDLEVILVDDGSPDNCSQICDEYEKKDNRVRTIHQQNGGVSHARNVAIKIARGSYMTFVDSDDWVESDMISEMVKKAIEHDVDMVRCGYRNISVTGRHLEDLSYGKTKLYHTEKYGGLLKQCSGNVLWTVPCCTLYKSELVRKVMFPENIIHEDNYFSPMVMYFSRKIIVLEDVYYNSIQDNPECVSNTTSEKPFDKCLAYQRLYQDLQKVGFEYIKAKQKIAIQYYHYIYKNRKNCRCRVMQKELFKFLMSSLDVRRKLLLLSAVLGGGIKIK